MTLHTRVMVTSPNIQPKAVFDKMRELIGATDEFTWKHRREVDRWSRNPSYSMDLGQGLPALMWIDYGADGPLISSEWDRDEEYETEEIRQALQSPEGWVEINFDTAYDYREPNGAGCGDLHAYLLREIGAWLTERDVTWRWYDESGHGWVSDRPLGDADLGKPALPITRDLWHEREMAAMKAQAGDR